ncbi:MAG: hypothetical protein E6J34_00460 [Chloroflexi bacterium]|nr:MAG: hypothetical protein E6J34_00460 [Chloroflexota bacterium]
MLNQRVLLAAISGQPSGNTQAELEAIALSLNAKEASIKAAKPAYFRGQHDEQLQTLIEEEPLRSLDQKQFHSVIRKVAQEQALTPHIALEILRRLEQQLLKDNDLYTLSSALKTTAKIGNLLSRPRAIFLSTTPHMLSCYSIEDDKVESGPSSNAMKSAILLAFTQHKCRCNTRGKNIHLPCRQP